MRLSSLIVPIVLVAALPLSAAGLEATARLEVDYLIAQVAASDKRFVRNGKVYSGHEAAAHMRQKLERAGKRVKSADDFVNGVATKSYLSGDPYLMKSPDGTTNPTGAWLTDLLNKYRQQAKTPPVGS